MESRGRLLKVKGNMQMGFTASVIDNGLNRGVYLAFLVGRKMCRVLKTDIATLMKMET